MTPSVKKYAVSVAYQMTVVLGLLFLPIAIPLSKVGVNVRFDRALETVREAHENVRD